MSQPLRLHLVRHGEVYNPNHLVYADLPGFDLSEEGTRQAEAAAEILAEQALTAVWSSPLVRALRTAEAIAARHGLPVRVDEELTEWRMLHRWRGHRWEDLPSTHPGELEEYLERPLTLPFADESVAELADRMVEVIGRALDASTGSIAVVGHQDSIHAAFRTISGLGLDDFHRTKPGHGEVITLEAPEWKLTSRVIPGAGGSL